MGVGDSELGPLGDVRAALGHREAHAAREEPARLLGERVRSFRRD